MQRLHDSIQLEIQDLQKLAWANDPCFFERRVIKKLLFRFLYQNVDAIALMYLEVLNRSAAKEFDEKFYQYEDEL